MSVINQESITSFVRKLQSFLLEEQILLDDTELKLYDTDATSLFKNKALLVLLPHSSLELSKIIKAINEYNKEHKTKVNFVARGAGTGLSGGAIASENSIIISLAKLDKLLELDLDNKTALVETGLVNGSLAAKLTGSGLHFAPDPSSQNACTIGGNVAENAGGIHCYKYGVTSDHIMALEIVLPDGEIVWLGSERFKTDGPDLVGLFVGSEGTFGIATRALLKLAPLPEAFLTMQVSFAAVRQAAELVAEIIKEGFKPAALEMMDTLTILAVDKAFNLGFRNADGSLDINAVLLIEIDGDKDEVELAAKKIKKLIDSYKPLRYEETSDPKVKDRLWKIRKGAVPAFGKLAPCWYLYDSTVPRSKIPEALDKISAIAKKYKLPLANVFHAADGNLHPNLLYDPVKDPGVVDRVHQASKEIMQVSIDLGGVLSGEHGIGLEKQEFMSFMFSEEDLAMMMKVRRVFDPELISNPNKLFPTKICYEASLDQKVNERILN